MPMDTIDLDSIRQIALTATSRRILSWMHDARVELRARSHRAQSEPFALDEVSALALRVGDLRALDRQVFVLTRTHTMATELQPAAIPQVIAAPRCEGQPDLAFPETPDVVLYLDAGDFDAEQREHGTRWAQQPQRVAGLARAANTVREHALRNAEVVTVLPQDFEERGTSYTVAAVTPGWVALRAITRFAEVADLRDRGVRSHDDVAIAAQFCLDRFLTAMHLARGDVSATIQGVAARGDDSIHGLHWSGRSGVGTAIDVFLRATERNVTTIDAIDAARLGADMTPWGHEYAHYLISAAADAAGLYTFEPRRASEITGPAFDDR